MSHPNRQLPNSIQPACRRNTAELIDNIFADAAAKLQEREQSLRESAA